MISYPYSVIHLERMKFSLLLSPGDLGNVLRLYGIYLSKLKIKIFYSLNNVRRRVHPPVLWMTEEGNTVR